MSRPLLRAPLVLVLALVALPVLVGSSRAADDDVVPGTDPVAARLLDAAARAETGVTFRAVELLSDADDPQSSVEVVDLSHVAGRGTVVAVDADGRQPGRAGLSSEDSRRPQLLLALLRRSYRLVLGRPSTVAGRPALLVVAERPDGVPAARFWLDRATGLLLQREVLTRRGRVASSQSLLRLWLSALPSPYLPPLLPSVATPSLDDAEVARWREDGWPCPHRLGSLSLFDARTVEGGTPVLHLTYSDGLSTASVFVQRGTLDPDAVPGAARAVVGGQQVLRRAGSPRQLVWSADGFVLTLVTDAPRDVQGSLVAGLPRSAPEPTGWSRVERGAARVFSWLNPFD